MLNLILFGGPGAGKGTQSAKLIEKYNLVHLSTGDILRAEIAAQTDLGLEAKKLMDKGDLVPDEVVVGMIEHKIDANKNANGFIFDGFPRTTSQAESLDLMLTKKGEQITKMLAIEVDADELMVRLQKRADEQNRPDDKNVDVIKNRINVYEEKTAIVANYYKKQSKFVAINGMGTIDQIFDRLCSNIDG